MITRMTYVVGVLPCGVCGAGRDWEQGEIDAIAYFPARAPGPGGQVTKTTAKKSMPKSKKICKVLVFKLISSRIPLHGRLPLCSPVPDASSPSMRAVSVGLRFKCFKLS